MGLLRRRPKINSTDTGFQALARLSLANDNDLLLERLMCVMPRSPEQPWFSLKDAYGVKLWDIIPTCQISGICEDDTVLLDGAFGATIHWDRFRKVANARRAWSWKRLACQIALHGAPYMLILGAILLSCSIDTQGLLKGVSTSFGGINTFYKDVNNTYSNLASEVRNLAPTDTTTKAAATSATASLPFKVESAAAYIETQVESAAASLESQVESKIDSKVFAFADKIYSAAPQIPTPIVKLEAAVVSANRWAVLFEVFSIFLILLASFIFLSTPYLTRMLYRGKFCK